MKGRRILLILAIAALLVGCGGVQTPSRPVIQGADQASGALTTKNMDAVHGQKTTCGGPAEKIFNIDVIEHNVDLGMGTSFAAWTYNGRIPAPTLEACEGD